MEAALLPVRRQLPTARSLLTPLLFLDCSTFCFKSKLYQCPPASWCHMPRGGPEAPTAKVRAAAG